MNISPRSYRTIVITLFLFCSIVGSTVAKAQTVSPQSKQYTIDFGSLSRSTLGAGWNNISSPLQGATARNLKDSVGSTSAIHVTITDAFWNRQKMYTALTGTTSSTLYPGSATVDSFFLGSYGGVTNNYGVMSVTGLTPGKSYTYRFYASAMETTGTNRTTIFAIQTAAQKKEYQLNATNNINTVIQTDNFLADTTGTMKVIVAIKPGASFGHLGVMEIIEGAASSVGTVQTTSNSCAIGALFDAQTGRSCTAVMIAGCAPGQLFNPATGVSCTPRPSSGGGGGGSSRRNANPTVQAGSDQTLATNLSSAVLSASASDSDGSIASYVWTQEGGPVTAVISTPTLSTTTVSGLSMSGTYLFNIRATDNKGATADDTVAVTISPQSPVLDTTAPALSSIVANNVTVSGALIAWSTNEPASSQVEYGATTAYGAMSTLSTPLVTTHGIVVTGLSSNTLYHYRVISRDSSGNLATSTDFTFTTAVSLSVPSVPQNVTATAGNASAAVSFAAPASTGGTAITSYTITSTLGSVTYSTTASPYTVQNLVNGTSYTFTVRAINSVGTGPASNPSNAVTPITPQAGGNASPIAYAGPNQTVRPNTVVSLDSTSTDSDGTILFSEWDIVSKVTGTQPVFNNSTYYSITPDGSISGLTLPGTYVLRLTTMDDDGATASDDMVITVLDQVNYAPVVFAGNDRTIVSPASSTILTPIVSDRDGTIVSYSWVQISGPASSISSPSTATTTITGMNTEGIYVYNLSVTDNFGATANDTVKLFKNAPGLSSTLNLGSYANYKPDLVEGMIGSITSVSGNTASVTSSTYSFTPADVGKFVVITEGRSYSAYRQAPITFNGKIVSVTNGVALVANFDDVGVPIVTSNKQMKIGTNNFDVIAAAISDAQTAGKTTILVPAGDAYIVPEDSSSPTNATNSRYFDIGFNLTIKSATEGSQVRWKWGTEDVMGVNNSHSSGSNPLFIFKGFRYDNGHFTLKDMILESPDRTSTQVDLTRFQAVFDSQDPNEYRRVTLDNVYIKSPSVITGNNSQGWGAGVTASNGGSDASTGKHIQSLINGTRIEAQSPQSFFSSDNKYKEIYIRNAFLGPGSARHVTKRTNVSVQSGSTTVYVDDPTFSWYDQDDYFKTGDGYPNERTPTVVLNYGKPTQYVSDIASISDPNTAIFAGSAPSWSSTSATLLTLRQGGHTASQHGMYYAKSIDADIDGLIISGMLRQGINNNGGYFNYCPGVEGDASWYACQYDHEKALYKNIAAQKAPIQNYPEGREVSYFQNNTTGVFNPDWAGGVGESNELQFGGFSYATTREIDAFTYANATVF